MNRTSLLGGVSGLAVAIVVAILVRMRSESPASAAEVQFPESPTEHESALDPVPNELPIPDPARIEGAATGRRSPARGLSESDFEARYGKLSPGERQWQASLISDQLDQAISARIDELHAQFAELRSRGQCCARVLKVDESPFVNLRLHHVHHVHCDVSSARAAIKKDGSAEIHVLEFCPRSDPTTCDLFEELAWLRNDAR